MMFEYEGMRRIQYEDGATFVPVCEKCGKPMYFKGIDTDPSSGLQTTGYGCFSLNSKHTRYETEPISDWEEFRQERKVEIHPNGRRMTDSKRRKILTMLAQGIPYPKIAKATRFSTPTICRMKQITVLATMSVAVGRLKCGILERIPKVS